MIFAFSFAERHQVERRRLNHDDDDDARAILLRRRDWPRATLLADPDEAVPRVWYRVAFLTLAGEQRVRGEPNLHRSDTRQKETFDNKINKGGEEWGARVERERERGRGSIWQPMIAGKLYTSETRCSLYALIAVKCVSGTLLASFSMFRLTLRWTEMDKTRHEKPIRCSASLT